MLGFDLRRFGAAGGGWLPQSLARFCPGRGMRRQLTQARAQGPGAPLMRYASKHQ